MKLLLVNCGGPVDAQRVHGPQIRRGRPRARARGRGLRRAASGAARAAVHHRPRRRRPRPVRRPGAERTFPTCRTLRACSTACPASGGWWSICGAASTTRSGWSTTSIIWRSSTATRAGSGRRPAGDLRHDPAADARAAPPGSRLIPVPRLRSRLGGKAVQDGARSRGCVGRPAEKPYGVMYVGSNWQRWEQVRRFLESYGPVRGEIGPGLPRRLGLERAAGLGRANGNHGHRYRSRFPCRAGCRDCATASASTRWSACSGRPGSPRCFIARCSGISGFVTNRTFETFYADTLPVLMLPRDFVAAIYGEAALALVPGESVAAHLEDALRQPEVILGCGAADAGASRRHHSYAQRFQELGALAEVRARPERRGEHPVRDEAPRQRRQHACGRELHAGRADARPLCRYLRHAHMVCARAAILDGYPKIRPGRLSVRVGAVPHQAAARSDHARPGSRGSIG